MSKTSPPITPTPRPWSPARKDHRVPRGTAEFGMYLFLAALGMLFASSMLGYVLVRWSKTVVRYDPSNPDLVRFPATAPPLGTIHPPMGLFFSTIIIFASSVTIHLALKNVRRERQGKFRAALIATLALSVLFILVQVPSMWLLLSEHDAANISNTMFGVIFFLILVHALHVLGGIIPLSIVTYRAGQNRYDHEHYTPVKNVTMYWHFLDAVWIFMFSVFWLVR